MAVKQPNLKAADSPIIGKGDPAARQSATQAALEATINEVPEVASALAARGVAAQADDAGRTFVELSGTTAELHAIGEYLTSYQPARNAFLNALVNRIGLTIVTSKLYRNPWAVFKRGYLEFGDTIEEIFVNLADVHGFYPEGAEDTFAKRELPDVRTAFHRMNFQKYYKTTVSSQQLRQAFLSWTGVSDLIARIIESLYTAANTDEYYVMRYFLAKCLLNGYIGSINIPEPTKDNAIDVATQFQYLSDLFQYQSTKYNMAGVTTHTDFEDQYFIITAKFKATMNMTVLATAFQLEYREFQARLITVDSLTDFDWARLDKLFTDPATGALDPGYARFTKEEIALLESIPAVLISRDWWMVLDNYLEDAQWFNGEGLYWNHWHHTWKTISCSPFGQAAAFTNVASKITSVTVTPATATLSPGASLQLSAAVAGTGIVNHGVQWTVTGGAASGTTVTNGGYLHVAANETAKTLTVTATSIQDGTKTGKSAITVTA